MASVKAGNFDYKSLLSQSPKSGQKDPFEGHAFEPPEGWKEGLQEVEQVLGNPKE